jgi:hypothetical protein
MKTLGLLFGGEAKVRIMRLFLFNAGAIFDADIVCQKTHINSKIAKKELQALEKADLIKRRSFYKMIKKKKRGKVIEGKMRSQGYVLNNDFQYMVSLKQLLMSTKTLEDEKIVRGLSKAGKLKLAIVAGVFIQDNDSRLDMLVVGDNLNKATLSHSIKKIESDLGLDIVYAYFETPDFEYRLSMNDRLIRDIIDYPHKVLLDRLSS